MTLIAFNEIGRAVGEGHHNAVLSNRDVELLLEMHEQGYGYRRLSRIFEISRSQTARICRGEQRHQVVAVGFRVSSRGTNRRPQDEDAARKFIATQACHPAAC